MEPDEFIVPDDPGKLRDLVDVLMPELKSRDIKITDLEQRLAGMNRHRFGAPSENADQLNLTLENAEIAVVIEGAGEEKPDAATANNLADVEDEAATKPKRKPLPDHFERNETELAPPSDSCRSCGGAMRKIGEDVTEELEYVPGRFVVNRILRPVAWQAMFTSPRRALHLWRLRCLRPGGVAVPPDRTRPARTGFAGAYHGLEVRGPSSIVSTERHLRPRGRGP